MTTLAGREEVPLDSIPLYNIANHLFYIVCPLIILLGTFGNVMTIIIMHRTTSGESAINYYFTGSGTISCWFLVCLTLHRAMSVVWPHRVNVMCTRRAVLCLMTGIALCFAALYAHYLYGFDLFVLDGAMTCLVQSGRYMQFVLDTFVYIEIAIYSYNQVAGYEYANAHMFYTISILLADSNSAVNFYLYCLTGKRFREEFFRTICCGRVRQSSDRSSVPKAMSAQSA
ncbi:hypothetical protein ACOMHN_045755 [Nucella lapillus]